MKFVLILLALIVIVVMAMGDLGVLDLSWRSDTDNPDITASAENDNVVTQVQDPGKDRGRSEALTRRAWD